MPLLAQCGLLGPGRPDDALRARLVARPADDPAMDLGPGLWYPLPERRVMLRILLLRQMAKELLP